MMSVMSRRIPAFLAAILIVVLAFVNVSAADGSAGDGTGAVNETQVEESCTADEAAASVDGSSAQAAALSIPVIQAAWFDASGCYSRLNYYRRLKKASKLKRDSRLEEIAMVRAKEMAETGVFSHTRPNGKSGLSLIKGKKAKGENIAVGYTSAEEVSSAWYASPSHRKNMLRKNFRKVGIAAYTYNGITYWAQVFSS